MAHRKYSSEEFLRVISKIILITAVNLKTKRKWVENYLNAIFIVYTKHELTDALNYLQKAQAIEYNSDEDIRFKLPILGILLSISASSGGISLNL